MSTIFDYLYPKYKVDKPIRLRLIELFAGYGSQALALELLGVPFEHYRVCEFDKYAIDTYNAFHNTNFETSDITKLKADDLGIVDTDKYTYIMTYSAPCTDISLAGKRAGMDEGSGTRSANIWEVGRLLKELNGNLPQILLMENVPTIIKEKSWGRWCSLLENLGYKNYCEILNSRDYYIPQNRERCFMVSILGDYSFNFPKIMQLKYRMKHFLESKVDEKYYLSEKMIKYITSDNEKWTGNNNKSLINKSIASTINTNEGSRRCDASNYICDELPDDFDLKSTDKIIKAGELQGGKWDKINENCRRVYNPNVLSPTITTCGGGNQEVKIIDVYNQYYTKECTIQETNKTICLNSKGGRGGVELLQPSLQDRVYSAEGISTAITSSFQPNIYINLRIRKLTPKECYRLMGVTDNYIDRVRVSNTQQYKQAGNSIVVSVLMAIFGKLLDIDYENIIKETYKK